MKIGFYQVVESLLKEKWDNEEEKQTMLKVVTQLDEKSAMITGTSPVSFIAALHKYTSTIKYTSLKPKIELIYGIRVNEVTVRNYLMSIRGVLDVISENKLPIAT